MADNCLLIVDLQNDFLPGGPLAVPDGDLIIPLVSRLIERYDMVVATQDWHPPDHVSFADNHPGHEVGEVIEVDGLEQVLWPVHCVQGTRGAALSDQLNQRTLDFVVQKGTDPRLDSYSGFFDNAHQRKTPLDDYLKSNGVKRLALVGLATDYCVKFTALDARSLGYETAVVWDGCRGIERQPGDLDRTADELRRAGVQITESASVLTRQGRGA